MTTSSPPTRSPFTLADTAVRRLQFLQARDANPDAGLRLSIRGGGCSGLSYVMEWVEKPKEKDKVFTRDGARVYVDSKSMLYLSGSELTFEESFMQSTFKIQNPQAKSSCGCGESFTV